MGDPQSHPITVHLGAFGREEAKAVAAELERAGIAWWVKEPGWFSQIWEYGVRLFVDKSRLAEARAIAQRVRAERTARG